MDSTLDSQTDSGIMATAYTKRRQTPVNQRLRSNAQTFANGFGFLTASLKNFADGNGAARVNAIVGGLPAIQLDWSASFFFALRPSDVLSAPRFDHCASVE